MRRRPKPEISTGRSQECREASRSKQYLGKARLGAWRRGLMPCSSAGRAAHC